MRPGPPPVFRAEPTTPRGGFEIGLERWTGLLTQAENIREVPLFPRDLHA